MHLFWLYAAIAIAVVPPGGSTTRPSLTPPCFLADGRAVARVVLVGPGDGGRGSGYLPRHVPEETEQAQPGLVRLLPLLPWLCCCCS